MLMKKILVSVSISVCTSLVLASAFLLLTPFTSFADSCSATCKDGSTVKCEADSKGNCAATDGIGCTGKTTKSCPKTGDEELQ